MQENKIMRSLVWATKKEDWEDILFIAQKKIEEFSREHREGNEINETISEQNLRKKILKFIRKIGVETHLVGYTYLEEAIFLVYQDKEYLKNFNNRLYPEIAKKYSTKPMNVERTISYAIKRAFNEGNYEFQNKIFTEFYDTSDGVPSNKQAIKTMVEYLKLH